MRCFALICLQLTAMERCIHMNSPLSTNIAKWINGSQRLLVGRCASECVRRRTVLNIENQVIRTNYVWMYVVRVVSMLPFVFIECVRMCCALVLRTWKPPVFAFASFFLLFFIFQTPNNVRPAIFRALHFSCVFVCVMMCTITIDREREICGCELQLLFCAAICDIRFVWLVCDSCEWVRTNEWIRAIWIDDAACSYYDKNVGRNSCMMQWILLH